MLRYIPGSAFTKFQYVEIHLDGGGDRGPSPPKKNLIKATKRKRYIIVFFAENPPHSNKIF